MERKETATATTDVGPEPARALDLDLTGSLLAGRYRIERRLGAGGMGVVYAARDALLGRTVAIKLVRAGHVSSTDEERLAQEARAMAKLRHPNVATLHDIGTFGDRLFAIMELVDGGTLADWMKAEPRSWRQIAAVFLQAARGLAAVHAAGFVHRDFKLPNVLIGSDGIVRVSDFGVARLVGVADQGGGAESDGPTPVTRTGAIVGTTGYIAPEQFRHEPIDGRADQFSFCVALYAALHGERPFDPEPGSHPAAESLGRLRPIRKHVAPRWLERVIVRGLASRPVDRWPSMDALAAAIEHGLGRSRRALLGGAAVATVVAAAVTVVAARRPGAPAVPRRVADLAQHQVTFDGRAELAALAPDGRQLVYRSSGHAMLADLDEARARDVASGILGPARWLPDSSAVDVIAYDERRGRHTFRVLRDGAAIPMPDLGQLASLSPDGTMTHASRYGGKKVTVLRGGEALRELPVVGTYTWLLYVDWAPDGRRLLVETEDAGWPTLWTLGLDGREQVRLVEEHAAILVAAVHPRRPGRRLPPAAPRRRLGSGVPARRRRRAGGRAPRRRGGDGPLLVSRRSLAPRQP